MASRLQHSLAGIFGVTAAVLLAGCNLDSSNAVTGATGGTSTTSAATAAQSTSVTISWMPPQTNADGSALTDLAGYHIHYGTQAGALNSEIDIPTSGVADYVVQGLNANSTYYFAVSSYNSEGVESADSAVISVGT